MKIVVNNCHGGFGLSHEGVLEYAQRKGIELYVEETGFSLRKYHYYTVPPEHYHECEVEWYQEDGDYRRINGSGWYFSINTIARDDPDLVATVEELGPKVNTFASKLAVIEIPDGIEWTIEEYDGLEHVAETHRTWLAGAEELLDGSGSGEADRAGPTEGSAREGDS